MMILIVFSFSAIGEEELSEEKKAKLNQFLQKEADSIQIADDVLHYISIQEVGTKMQKAYGTDSVTDETKEKITRAEERMISLQPYIWQVTDSLKVSPAGEEAPADDGKGFPIWTIAIVVLAISGTGLITYKIGGKGKAKFDVKRDADRVLDMIKKGPRVDDMIALIEKKKEIAASNTEEAANLSEMIKSAEGKLKGALLDLYKTGDAKKFEETVGKFKEELGLSDEEVELLKALLNKDPQKTKLGDNLNKIKSYNELLSRSADKNLKKSNEQVEEIKVLLNAENKKVMEIKNFEERLRRILTLQTGLQDLGKVRRLDEELKKVIDKDSEIGQALIKLIKYYGDVRPQVYNLKKTIENEDKIVNAFLLLISRLNSKNVEQEKGKIEILNKRMNNLLNIEYNAAKFLKDSKVDLGELMKDMRSVEDDLPTMKPKEIYVELEDMQEMTQIFAEVEKEENFLRAIERIVRSNWDKIPFARRIWDQLGKIKAWHEASKAKAGKGDNKGAKSALDKGKGMLSDAAEKLKQAGGEAAESIKKAQEEKKKKKNEKKVLDQWAEKEGL